MKFYQKKFSVNNFLKWTGCVFTILGALATSFHFGNYNIYLFNAGSLLYLIWSFRIKEVNIMVVNFVLLLIYFIGIFNWKCSLTWQFTQIFPLLNWKPSAKQWHHKASTIKFGTVVHAIHHWTEVVDVIPERPLASRPMLGLFQFIFISTLVFQ